MSEQEKTAKLSETQRAFITPLVGGVAAGGVAFGLPAALDKVREVRVKRNRDKYISAMKDVHPDLKGINKKDLHVAYNSMAMHSPHVLRDPLLGGQELLRMSKYRQADVNSLNEINKLRGNSMMDQAFMNATNFVASGVSEGFKGYQAQRQADADSQYRQKMDRYRQRMEDARLKLEKDKFEYTQDRDLQKDRNQEDRDDTLQQQFLRNMAVAEAKSAREEEKHEAWIRAGRPASASYLPERPKRYRSSVSSLRGIKPIISSPSTSAPAQQNFNPALADNFESKTKRQKRRARNKRAQEKKSSFVDLSAVVAALRDRNL